MLPNEHALNIEIVNNNKQQNILCLLAVKSFNNGILMELNFHVSWVQRHQLLNGQQNCNVNNDYRKIVQRSLCDRCETLENKYLHFKKKNNKKKLHSHTDEHFW